MANHDKVMDGAGPGGIEGDDRHLMDDEVF